MTTADRLSSLDALCRNPYRLFFPLGILAGLIGVGDWAMWTVGYAVPDIKNLHLSLQSQGFLTFFAVGFLMTALPRFAGAEPARPWELAAATGCAAVFLTAAMLRSWAVAHAATLLLLLILPLFAARRFAGRTKPVPPSFALVAGGLAHGVLGAALSFAGEIGWATPAAVAVGRQMIQLGFLLCLVLGITAKLAPYLTGYTDDPACDDPGAILCGPHAVAPHALTVAVLMAGFFAEPLFPRLSAATRALAALAHLVLFARILRPPRKPTIVARLFWVSCWCVPLGLGLAALFPRFRVSLLHVVFIGGYSLMIFSFGLLVSLSHSGRASLLNGRLRPLKAVAALAALALVCRLGADLVPARYMLLLHSAAGFWVVAAIVWLSYAVWAHLGRPATVALAVLCVLSAPALAGPAEFSGELRLRPEYRHNPDFDSRTRDTQAFTGSRFRLSVNAAAADDVAVKATFQDTRIWGEEAGSATGFTDTGEAVDMHEIYAEFRRFAGLPFTLRAGRQELSYGDNRLVGPLNWNNQARAFDAFRVMAGTRAWTAEVFAAKRRENNGSTAGAPERDRDLSGVYLTWKKPGGALLADAYAFQDREGDVTSVARDRRVTTAGVRLAARGAGFDATVEAPWQFGDDGTVVGASSADVKVSARALAAKAGYTFAGPRELRVGVEYDFASGDGDAADRRARTFHNLYPTNHYLYGTMDQQGWRNMRAVQLALSAKPAARWWAALGAWDFRLAEARDGWYNASGSAAGALRAASAANTEKRVGREVDLTVRFAQTARIQWEAGGGVFWPGRFVRRRVVDAEPSAWAYLSSSVGF